jgi:hypothetical protein
MMITLRYNYFYPLLLYERDKNVLHYYPYSFYFSFHPLYKVKVLWAILCLKKKEVITMFGSWTDYRKPLWETYLEEAPESVIHQTKLSRQELKEILDILYENRIIN